MPATITTTIGPGQLTGTRHYAVTTGGAEAAALADCGLNVFDIAGSTGNPNGRNAVVNALPAGTQAMIWVGNLDNTNCATPGFTFAQFSAQVDALAGNPRVWGYYLSDEPHPMTCRDGPEHIRERADYIHANAPGHKAFILVVDGTNYCGGQPVGCEFAALRPEITHVDIFGLDPYPCHYEPDQVTPAAFDLGKIDEKVNAATANGIPIGKIAPVYQTFGSEGRTDAQQVYYRTPTVTELGQMLGRWDSFAPAGGWAMDFCYSYGVQCGASCHAPQALANHSELRTVILDHHT